MTEANAPFKKELTLTVDQRVPAEAFKALERLAGVTATRAPQTTLISRQHVAVLDVVEVAVNEVPLDPPTAGLSLLLVRGVLSDEEVLRLEDQGWPFVDASGHAWLPGVPRTPQRRSNGPLRVRHETLRAAQQLADHPDRRWSGGTLSSDAHVSRRTAERLIARLADQGLVDREGHGRAGSAQVSDVVRLRRWLLMHGRQDFNERVTCFIHDPAALPAEVDGMRLVRTGSHGASLLGIPVVSSTARPMIRVDVAGRDLDDLPSLLRAVRTTRGANLVLVADPGRLAADDARHLHDVWVAPPSRLALDMLLEPRGEAAADVFLELWQDRVL